MRDCANSRLRYPRDRGSAPEARDQEDENGGLMDLVDTPVWIRFLADRKPYAAELDRLLARDEAAGHDLVYGELLIGDVGVNSESSTGRRG